MNQLLNRIFGISTNAGELGFGASESALSFVHPLPTWGVVLGIVILGSFVWWSYRAVPGSVRARGLLGVFRLLSLVILGAVALGPMIEQTSVTREQDWALVLLDRSGSMQTRDALIGDGAKRSLATRDEQLIAMLDDAGEDWQSLGDRKHVVWMGFGDGTTSLGIGRVPTAESLSAPSGRSTNIGDAISAALDSAAARPISSIVIASDGRSFDAIDPELVNRLTSLQVPIVVVPMGSASPVRDLGITRVEYPSAVFADDLVPIRVELRLSGITQDEIERGDFHVELVDHASGEVIDSAPIGAEQMESEVDGQTRSRIVQLAHTPTGDGEREYDVVIRSKRDGTEVDLNATNDSSSVKFQVVDRPMRVLYVDGYPRWEHRYLKNLLIRERSITSSSMLLATSRRYIQEGDQLIASIPSSEAEWEPFDVVIIGDVRPELFSAQQLESLLAHVTDNGAGVLWIAGQSANPSSWLSSTVSSLLPMRGDAGGSQQIVTAWKSPVTMRSTDEAVRLGVLGLNDERDGWFDRLDDPSTGWSQLQWALALDETSFKPGVAVLATARAIDAKNTEQSGSPIVTMMRYGAGQSVFVGTDEIWRWRYGRGEDLPERFWLPLIRSIGRGTIDRRLAPAMLTAMPTSPTPGQPTQVTLRLFDQSRIDSMPEQIKVTVRSSVSTDEPVELTLVGTGEERSGTWIPDEPGIYQISPTGLDAAMSMISARVGVLDVSDEQRQLDSDHALLESLATQSGGMVVAPDAFASIPSLLPNRARTVSSPPLRTSLWDRPVVLVVLVLLLSAEWIGRRILRLA